MVCCGEAVVICWGEGVGGGVVTCWGEGVCGEVFWEGDFDAAKRHVLEPSGIDLNELKATPGGLNLGLTSRYRKYAEIKNGKPVGFGTPSKKVELFSETFLNNGYDPLPSYVEPAVGPYSRPDLADKFPLVLTDTKTPHFIHSQYRHVGRLCARTD